MTAVERAAVRMWTRRVDLYLCEPMSAGFRFGAGREVFKVRLVLPACSTHRAATFHTAAEAQHSNYHMLMVTNITHARHLDAVCMACMGMYVYRWYVYLWCVYTLVQSITTPQERMRCPAEAAEGMRAIARDGLDWLAAEFARLQHLDGRTYLVVRHYQLDVALPLDGGCSPT